ncbi:hypothetical protein NE237_002685 [Protea cynaroides]|uniref:Uncharacterized protein n=1 Tax=Protea cynaroides TaxID=273540 RepID=A0A9Q0JSH5_9MAGN|nr:hypothetical protein NE237_002685 [Protea cynaroides]
MKVLDVVEYRSRETCRAGISSKIIDVRKLLQRRTLQRGYLLISFIQTCSGRTAIESLKSKNQRYTGEDGFEISVTSECAVDLAKVILENSEGKIRLAGLGARDSSSLKLVYVYMLEEGPTIRRVGFSSSGLPARSHSEIVDDKGEGIGGD